ncbi:hypothetical protein PCASD_15736 [Puccinia coronata f. sp. avenae]|uniref:Uncharacterized protein n=1 Tax=Puccinia coronata f. sp. avenae TaxID=200324 RepID=A0A2N5U795_9BASI|nr:hypothetical protein PCASD_15736 [Puccinia coronata f. sp. avenae]
MAGNGQVSLLAELVYTSMAVRITCPPSWFTPAWQAGSPDRHPGVHQLGEQAHLTAILVYTSLASRLT